MNLLAFISILCSIIIFFFGVFVLQRNPKRSLNRVFFLLCVSAAYLSFVEYGFRQAETYEEAFYWLDIIDLWLFAIPLELHFVLLFTEKDSLTKNKIFLAFLYLPSILFLVLLPKYIKADPFKESWGWTFDTIPKEHILISLFEAWFVVLGCLSIGIAIHYFLKNKEYIKKQRAKFVFLGVTISTAIALIIQLALSLFDIRLPDMTGPAYVIEASLLGYAIRKYQLFALTPATAADSIISTMADALFLVSPEGKIVTTNQAAQQLLGYPERALIGKPVSTLFTLEEQIRFEGIWRDCVAGKDLKGDIEATFSTKKGKSFPVSLSGSVMLNEEGAKLGVVCVARDLTERKRAEKALHKAKDELEVKVAERTKELARTNEELRIEIAERKQVEGQLKQAKETAETANKAKSAFLANMSHELRTPLNHIIGFTQLILDKHIGEMNEQQEEYLNDVFHSAKHLLSLINDILDLSKVESGKLDLELKKVNLKLLLENSLIMVKEKALKHGIQISLDMDAIPVEVDVDERKFKQIIYNLLSNAVKFTPDKGTIAVSAKRYTGSENLNLKLQHHEPARLIELSVSDTGIGIDPKYLERIFKPFEQIDNSTSRDYPGTGLGLSLTKSLVELHGGEIWAESEGLGKGSTFRFIIPI